MTTMNAPAVARLNTAEVATNPFRHVVVPDLFDPDDAERLLSWLETDAKWWTQERDFYVHESCDNLEVAAAMPSGAALSKAARRQMAIALSRLFDIDLDGEHATIAAHRMTAGQGVGIHTDDPSLGTEALRLVVTLRRGEFSDPQGGHLVLFSEHSVDAVGAIIRPLHNTGVAFPLTGQSVHAVNDVVDGDRYSVVLGFWDRAQMGSAQVPGSRRSGQRRSISDVADIPGAADVAAFLEQAGARRIAHSGATLLDHLIGVAAILADWGCDAHVCRAGLLHSVYGTATFDGALFDGSHRDRIASVAGARAEALAWLFCTVRFGEVYKRDDTAGRYQARLRDGASTMISHQDVCELNLLACANLFEQSPAEQLGPNEVYEWRSVLARINDDLPARARAQLTAVFGPDAGT
jgi:hypothetical protein